MTIEEVQFDTEYGTIAGWQTGSGTPVLALHGWQDNANSFLPLSKYLNSVKLIAIDLPGHGLSEHLRTENYHLFDYLPTVSSIASLITVKEKQKPAILGHSLGAIIAAILSAVTEHVQQIVLLDALGGISAEEEFVVSVWKKALRDLKPGNWPKYKDRSFAVKARSSSKITISKKAVEILCERGVKRVAGGFSWRHDRKLNRITPYKLTEAQWLTLFSEVNVPVSLFQSKAGWLQLLDESVLEARKEKIKDLTQFFPDGGHFFHMEGDLEKLANQILEVIRESSN